MTSTKQKKKNKTQSSLVAHSNALCSNAWCLWLWILWKAFFSPTYSVLWFVLQSAKCVSITLRSWMSLMFFLKHISLKPVT